MNRILQDTKVALRALSRQRVFTAVAVLTLALGVGATTAIFSVVYGVLLRPLPYVEADRLVHLGQTLRSAPAEPVDGSSRARQLPRLEADVAHDCADGPLFGRARGHQQPG